MSVSKGDLVRLPGEIRYVKVSMVDDSGVGVMLAVEDDQPGRLRQVTLTRDQAAHIDLVKPDGRARSEEVLAGLWAEWMGLGSDEHDWRGDDLVAVDAVSAPA